MDDTVLSVLKLAFLETCEIIFLLILEKEAVIVEDCCYRRDM